MTKTLKTTLLAGAMTLGLTGAAHADHMAYSLADGDDGSTLVRFAPDATGFTGTAITGADGEALALDALTYRPQTGQLYGYSADDDAIYVVDPMTGRATVELQSDQDLPEGFVSFDFNPTLDAVRIVNADRSNVVYFPQDSADTQGRAGVLTFAPTDLFYADGYDETDAPGVLGNGYTNQVPLDETGGMTVQYVLDADTDTLGILNNNAGSIDFVADVTLMGTGEGVDFDLAGGFDVFTAPDGTNIGYALLETVGGVGFYEIGLQSGVATLIGLADVRFGDLTSLAVFVPGMDMMDPIPVPAAALLFPVGAAGLAAARRRKAKA